MGWDAGVQALRTQRLEKSSVLKPLLCKVLYGDLSELLIAGWW